MKKFLANLTTVALLLNLFSLLTVYSAPSIYKDWTFNELIAGPMTDNADYQLANGGGVAFSIVPDPLDEGHGNVTNLLTSGSQASTNPYLGLKQPPAGIMTTGQKFHFSVEFMADDNNFSNFGIVSKHSYNSAAAFATPGFLTVNNNITVLNQNISAFTTGKWYKIDIVMEVNKADQSAEACDIYLNDKLVSKTAVYTNPFDFFNDFRLNLNAATTAVTSVYFDNVVYGVYDDYSEIPVNQDEDEPSERALFDFFDFSNISGNGVGLAVSGSNGRIDRSNMSTTPILVGSSDSYASVDSTPETGVFGKLTTDKSAKIDSTITKFTSANNIVFNPHYKYTPTVPVTQAIGEKTHVTFQVAFDELNYRQFKIVGRNDTTWLNSNPPLFCSEQGGSGYIFKVFSETLLDGVMPKVWYQVDIIGDLSANGLYDVYLNGTKLLSNKVTPSNWNVIGDLRLDMSERGSSKIYFDNFGYGVYGTGNLPVIKSAVPTTSLANAVINEKVKTITTSEPVAVSSFLASLTLSDQNAVAKIIENGSEKTTGNLEIGNYLVVTNGATENYYRVDPKSHYMLSYKFDNYSVVNEANTTSNIGLFRSEKFSTSGPNTSEYQVGIGGKSPIDVSLNMKADNVTYDGVGTGSYGDSVRDPFLQAQGFNEGEFADISGEKLVVSASILAKDYNSSRPVQLTSGAALGSNWLAPFNLRIDGKIITGQGDAVVGTYELNKWYNLTAVINMGTTSYDLYINGNQVNTTGVAISSAVPTNLARIKLVQSLTDQIVNNRTSESYYDDIQVYIGDYIPEPVSASFSETGYSIDGDDIIALTEVITGSGLKNSITTSADMRIYSDDTYTTIVSDTADLVTGNILVLEKGNILKYYTILDTGLLLRPTADYDVDIVNNIVKIYKNTAAEKLISVLTPYSVSSTASIVNSAGNPKTTGLVANTDKIRVTNGSTSVDYTIVIEVLVDDNFNSYSNKASVTTNTTNTSHTPSGWFFGAATAGETDVYVQGVAHDVMPGNNMLKFYSDAKVASYQFSLEKNYIVNPVVGTVALEVSMNAKDYNATRLIANKGINTSGTDGFFDALVSMDSDKSLKMLGIKLGEYELDTWYNLKVIFDISTGYMQVYNNGVLVYEGMSNVTNLTSITNIRMQQYTIKDGDPCETWFDNFAFYNVGKNVFTDYSFKTTLASDTLVIDNNFVPRICIESGTVASVLEDLDFTNVGYMLAVFDNVGSEKIDDYSLQAGDTLRVTSNDGTTVADYAVTNELYTGRLQIKDSQGNPIRRFTTGEITAEIDLAVFKSADVKEYAISIAQYNGAGQLVGISYIPHTAVIAQKDTLVAPITITSATGSVKAFVMEGSSLKPLCEAVRITPQ